MGTGRLLALDTEDDSLGTVGIINFFDGTRHQTFTRRGAESDDAFRARAWNWLYTQAPCTVWACNAEYDLINLFGRWLGKMVTLQYVASGLLRGSLRDRPVTFLDTLRHWPMSVEQMGEFLKYPKLAKDFQSVAYCRRDTEIVYYFVIQMLERYTALGLATKATLPSMAMQWFQKDFYRKPFPRLPEWLVTWFRDGYYGGRVEVFRFGEIAGPVHHYDVNSLFPSVMVHGRYPDLRSYHHTPDPDWTEEGMARVTITVPRTTYPPLPMRGAEDMLYPYGTMTGTWCYPEIRQALADGSDILSVHDAWEFKPIASPFKEYVHECYHRRLASTHPLDTTFWKLMMNSLYGKFGQRPGLEMIYDDRDIMLNTKLAPAANVIWAAYVTCFARVRLLHLLRSTSECYYTDTDSLLTPDVLPTSPELGDLKLEGIYQRLNCVGNKMYAVEVDPDTYAGMNPKQRTGYVNVEGRWTHYKAKGVRREAAGDFIRTGRAVFRKPARFRESRRTAAIPNRWYEVEKRRLAEYTKRIVHPDGTTEPWEWGAYQAAREA